MAGMSVALNGDVLVVLKNEILFRYCTKVRWRWYLVRRLREESNSLRKFEDENRLLFGAQFYVNLLFHRFAGFKHRVYV